MANFMHVATVFSPYCFSYFLAHTLPLFLKKLTLFQIGSIEILGTEDKMTMKLVLLVVSIWEERAFITERLTFAHIKY